MILTSLNLFLVTLMIFFSSCFDGNDGNGSPFSGSPNLKPGYIVTHDMAITQIPSPDAGNGIRGAASIKASEYKFAYDFEHVKPGTVSSPATLFVHNYEKKAVVLTEITIQGPDAGEFKVVSQPQFPLTLEPQDTVSFNTVFAPLSAANKRAKISVKAEQGGSFDFDITGNSADEPEIAVWRVFSSGPSLVPNVFSLDKKGLLSLEPPVVCGFNPDNMPTTTYIIRNSGTQPLILDEFALQGEGASTFSMDVSAPVTVLPGESLTVPVTFDSRSPEGVYDATLVVHSNDTTEDAYGSEDAKYSAGPSPCATLTVHNKIVHPSQPGTGMMQYSFGDVGVPSAATLEVFNTGSGPMEISLSDLQHCSDGSSNDHFSLQDVNAPSGVIQPGESYEFDLIFTPDETQDTSGEVFHGCFELSSEAVARIGGDRQGHVIVDARFIPGVGALVVMDKSDNVLWSGARVEFFEYGFILLTLKNTSETESILVTDISTENPRLSIQTSNQDGFPVKLRFNEELRVVIRLADGDPIEEILNITAETEGRHTFTLSFTLWK